MVERFGKSAFGSQILTLPLSSIVPQREPTLATKRTACYKQIASSLEHIGLIEPLVVCEQSQGTFLLVDGNTRFEILKSGGAKEVACILATDDESYTYNKRVSAVPPILQHYMLLRVLENGVSEERVAAALNVDIKAVRQRRDMLEGICPEVTRLLEPHRLGIRCFSAIRRMKPLRQIEAAEHMISSSNFTLPFLRAILLVTKPEMLNNRDLKGRLLPVHGPANALLEREHEGLVRGLKAVECSFGSDMLCLAVSLKYLERIAKNPKIKRYLEATCPETAVVIWGLLKDSHA
jgi:RepB plasmid partitioning protein/ParB-like nuclease domain